MAMRPAFLMMHVEKGEKRERIFFTDSSRGGAFYGFAVENLTSCCC
jgi:hypothetical protein